MKFIQFVDPSDGRTKPGTLQDGMIQEISGSPLSSWNYTGSECAVESVKMRAPIQPRHIIGIGKNYIESGENKPEKLPEIPVFFYKPVTTVIGSEEDIILPGSVEEVKFEAELAVIIGKSARHIEETDALNYIFGYTVANDVTAPSLFHPDGHWTLGKAVDTFTPLGPVVDTDLDLSNIRIRSLLNGSEKQNSGLENIIVDIPYMIAYLSRILTLQPGDVILTGAPAGAVMMKAGDTIECVVDGIGNLRNTVVSNVYN